MWKLLEIANKRQESSEIPSLYHAWVNSALHRQVSRARRQVRTLETPFAILLALSFALPLLTFTTPLTMNGVNRAANQLSRKPQFTSTQIVVASGHLSSRALAA